MTFTQPTCPTCGQAADRIVEDLSGLACLIQTEPGSFDYEGQTLIDWNSQKTTLDPQGRASLLCPSRHCWQSTLNP